MRILFMMCLSAFSLSVFAQGPPPKGKDEKKEKIEALKKEYLTSKLNLTDKEGQAFWPVYDAYQQKNNQLRDQRKSLMKGTEQASDAELEKNIQQGFDLKQKELELDKQYYAEFKKILPVKKIAILYKAERDFKREVLKQVMGKGDE